MKRGALVGMLRSIMAFLRTRFPAVLGLNVLWSLALFRTSSPPPPPPPPHRLHPSLPSSILPTSFTED